MKKLLFIVVAVLSLTSCGTQKSKVITRKADQQHIIKSSEANAPVAKVIEKAKTFEGTPYKFGGTSTSGMDCSGLIYTCYLEQNVKLPRTSRAMAGYGEEIKEKDIAPGDLLFFRTNKSSRKINHVGLVIEKTPEQVYFIHSTSSRGVIISTLEEYYWKSCFVMVRRVI